MIFDLAFGSRGIMCKSIKGTTIDSKSINICIVSSIGTLKKGECCVSPIDHISTVICCLGFC